MCFGEQQQQQKFLISDFPGAGDLAQHEDLCSVCSTSPKEIPLHIFIKPEN
jgi:hypothetical protein